MLEVIRNLIHIEGRSWVKWINVLIVHEPILHRVGEDIPVDLFKLIICEDPVGSKRMLKATTMFVESACDGVRQWISRDDHRQLDGRSYT